MISIELAYTESCVHCGARGLAWTRTRRGWRLMDTLYVIHNCPEGRRYRQRAYVLRHLPRVRETSRMNREHAGIARGRR